MLGAKTGALPDGPASLSEATARKIVGTKLSVRCMAVHQPEVAPLQKLLTSASHWLVVYVPAWIWLVALNHLLLACDAT
jgi:hypothetical protein